MNDHNEVSLIGRLTQNCVLEKMPNGISFLRFCIASKSDKKNNEGFYEEIPNFFHSVIFDKYAENLVKYMTKGTQLCLDGKLSTKSVKNPDGSNSTRLIIKTKSIQLLGVKKSEIINISENVQEDKYDLF